MSRCPGDDALALFVDRGLAADEERVIKDHLDGCATCRGDLGAIVRALRDTRQAPAHASALGSVYLAPGTMIDSKYRVEALVGSGGMGAVYRAEHVGLRQPVAIKVLHADLAAEEGPCRRFLREARASAALHGEHCVRVFDVGALPDGAPFLAMELLDGEDLHELLRARGRLPVDEAVRYALGICRALEEAHGVGIVHRDLKPQNVVVTRAGGVKVVDFGLARVIPGVNAVNLTATAGSFVGSPLYMSPEQLRCEPDVDARTDIWSLGATLYQLLAGDPPFVGPTVAVIHARILGQDPPALRRLRPDVPPALEGVIARCLRRDREERLSSASELARALEASLAPDAAPRTLEPPTLTLAELPPNTQREEDIETESIDLTRRRRDES